MNAARTNFLNRWPPLVALLAGSALLLTPIACKKAAKLDAAPQTALGEVAAALTAEVLDGKGKVVLLVGAEDQKPETGTGKALEAFREGLKRTGVQVQAVEIMPASGTPQLSGMDPVPAGKFMEAITKHASADAIVSFAGAPRFDAQQIAQLPNPRPKFIAAITFNPPLKAMFSAGVLHAAVVTRPAAQPVIQPGNTRERFDAYYQLIRADNANSLPW